MFLLLEIVDENRSSNPPVMSIGVQIPGDNWINGGCDIEEASILDIGLARRGVDLIDASTSWLM
jgi:2,4-dienoyl-CoA reductase-like NADH-dependent reductase (Old Yellow Enzyme family)